MSDPGWMHQAACRKAVAEGYTIITNDGRAFTAETDWWFVPERGATRAVSLEAQRICHACPVFQTCGDTERNRYLVSGSATHGRYGPEKGVLSVGDSAPYKTGVNRKKTIPGPDDIEHGTYRGWRAHRRFQVPYRPDCGCENAANAYKRDWRIRNAAEKQRRHDLLMGVER